MYSSFLFPILTAGLASAQLADQYITPLQADAYSCGAACYAAYNASAEAELVNLQGLGKGDFYETAKNFTGSKPGDLLKLEALDPKTLFTQPGTTAYRIQYTSKDLDGSPVPVTGFVAFPYSLPEGQDKFRMMTWAHGTSGLHRACVPSGSNNLYKAPWYPALTHGYAVVATDYAGLGNNYTTHKYVSYPAHASDVYYSNIAARKAFPGVFAKEWVSYGHSQGGGAVWRLAESDYVQDEKEGYLGTVVLAPGVRVVEMALKNYDTYPQNGLHVLVPTAVRRFNSSYNGTFLSDVLEKRTQLAELAQACIFGSASMIAGLSKEEIISRKRLKRDMSVYEAWQKAVSPAMGAKSSSPVLLVQGLNDTQVIPYATKEAWKTACDAGNEVHLRLYPELEHIPLVSATASDWIAWVDDLFNNNNKRQKGKCSSETKKPFDAKHVQLNLP
ncbi:hypothetical protein Golomagni_06288 [Golovinomyces magnicellulatus]|nr:hypothetical protein Golomagni_06288 [Golovinomyces magnicellulatus]